MDNPNSIKQIAAAEREALLAEWLKHLHDAQRFGSKEPAAIADILTFGESQQEAAK